MLVLSVNLLGCLNHHTVLSYRGAPLALASGGFDCFPLAATSGFLGLGQLLVALDHVEVNGEGKEIESPRVGLSARLPFRPSVRLSVCTITFFFAFALFRRAW